MTCFAGDHRPTGDGDKPKGHVTYQPTLHYQLIYLQYERIHRTHPFWPLSDLRGMTPRQRKYWLAMGEARAKK